jgi:hypothetical protein
MRKIFVFLVAAVVTLGLSAPTLAQTPPPAPTPKVTINGLVDFVSGYYKNSTGDVGANRSRDITNDDDEGWYTRERGVFTLTGEIGRAKGVLALEFDFHNGRTVTNFDGGGFGGNLGMDIETDEKAQAEVKWLYLEAPITGPGSLLPFLPMPTNGRFGAQPARGHDYKPGILLSGDFPGIALETMWAPNLRSTVTYVQIDEQLDPITNPGGTEDWAIVGSVELDIFKGFTVKPTFAYARYDGGNSSGNTGTFARGGFNPNAANQFNAKTERYTFGGDVRWTTGPFSLAPTFLYQWGKQEVAPGVIAGTTSTQEVDINSFLLDVIGGFRSGPLNIEVRAAYTPGMKADDCVQTIAGLCSGGDDIKTYEPINQASTNFWAGWSEIEASGIDYNVSLRQNSGNQLGRSPSYDKYGRLIVGAAVDYALTPALVFHLVGNAQWTAEKVDTGSTLAAGTGTGSLVPSSGGDDNFLGWELDAGFTYRFAPSVVFDFIVAYLNAGPARDHGPVAPLTPLACASAKCDAEDAWKAAARLRVTW